MPSRTAPRKPALVEQEFTFEVIPARELSPQDASCIVVGGPPGTGKSTFLGRMAQEGPTLLLATLQRETSSWIYQEKNVGTMLFEDREWQPDVPADDGTRRGNYAAHAHKRLLDALEMLRNDEITAENGEPYKVVLLDSGTEAGENAWHRALAPYRVPDPSFLGRDDNRYGPYTALDQAMDQLVKALQALKTAPVPKHIGISWHVQPTKDDTVERIGDKQTGYTVKKQSADHKTEGIEYEGSILPMVRGRFRRRLFSLVDAFIWTDIQYDKTRDTKGKVETTPKYVLQVVSDEERHCKLPGPLPAQKYIPNDWKTFKKLLALGQDTTSTTKGRAA